MKREVELRATNGIDQVIAVRIASAVTAHEFLIDKKSTNSE